MSFEVMVYERNSDGRCPRRLYEQTVEALDLGAVIMAVNPGLAVQPGGATIDLKAVPPMDLRTRADITPDDIAKMDLRTAADNMVARHLEYQESQACFCESCKSTHAANQPCEGRT